MMKHHCLVCNNKHSVSEIQYPSREDRLAGQRDRLKAIRILSKLFYLPPEVHCDLSIAAYCLNCTTKLCQLEEIYSQIELCQANIVQSRREFEVAIVKATYQNDVIPTTTGTGGDDEILTKHIRKMLCNLIHYKPASDIDNITLGQSTESFTPPRKIDSSNENSEEQTSPNDQIGLDDDAGAGGEFKRQQQSTPADEDAVENVKKACHATTVGGAGAVANENINDIKPNDRNTSQVEDEEMPYLDFTWKGSFSASGGGDQIMEDADDGNPPLIEKFDQMKNLKRKAKGEHIEEGVLSEYDEKLARKKCQMIDEEKTMYLKRLCISKKCQVVLQPLESPILERIKNSLTKLEAKRNTPTFNKRKGPGQGRGKKAIFSSPIKSAISGDSSSMVGDEDPSSFKQNKIIKGILAPADRTTQPNRSVKFRSPIANIKTFTPEKVEIKLKKKQSRKIVKLVGKKLGRPRKIQPVLKSYVTNEDISQSAFYSQNNENKSITSSRSSIVMEKIRSSEAMIKSKLNFRRTIPYKSKSRYNSTRKSNVKSASTTSKPKSTGKIFTCECGRVFKMEWRYKNHLKLLHCDVHQGIAKPTTPFDKLCEICNNKVATHLYKKHLILCKIKNKKGKVVNKKTPKLGKQTSMDKLLQIGKNIKKAAGEIKTSLSSHSHAQAPVVDESARVIPIHMGNVEELEELNETEMDQNNGIMENSGSEVVTFSPGSSSKKLENFETPTIILSDFAANETENTTEGESSKLGNKGASSTTNNPAKNNIKFRCPYTDCDLEVIGKGDLISHLKYHMGLPNSRSGTQDHFYFRCPYVQCDEQSENKGSLIEHLKDHMAADENPETEK